MLLIAAAVFVSATEVVLGTAGVLAVVGAPKAGGVQEPIASVAEVAALETLLEKSLGSVNPPLAGPALDEVFAEVPTDVLPDAATDGGANADDGVA